MSFWPHSRPWDLVKPDGLGVTWRRTPKPGCHCEQSERPGCPCWNKDARSFGSGSRRCGGAVVDPRWRRTESPSRSPGPLRSSQGSLWSSGQDSSRCAGTRIYALKRKKFDIFSQTFRWLEPEYKIIYCHNGMLKRSNYIYNLWQF